MKPPRMAFVEISVDADILFGSAPDHVIGRLIRNRAKAALKQLKELVPNPEHLAVRSQLSAYDREEMKAWKKEMGVEE